MKWSEIQEDRVLAPKTPYQALIDDYVMFTTLNLAHLEKGAKDENAKQELIKVIRNIMSPKINGKNITEIPLSVLEKNENKLKVLHHIYDTINYALSRFKMYLSDEEYQKRKPRFKKLLQLYSKAVDEFRKMT